MKAEYRDNQKLSSASSHHSVVSGGPGRRDSYGLYRDQMARRSLRRSTSASEGVYTIPHTEQTSVPLGPPTPGQYNIGGPVLDTRGAHHPPDLWSRQTSLDTSYNVPSIRSEVGDTEARPHTSAGRLGRFDSIAEVTESRTETEDQPWRNRGSTQQTF